MTAIAFYARIFVLVKRLRYAVEHDNTACPFYREMTILLFLLYYKNPTHLNNMYIGTTSGERTYNARNKNGHTRLCFMYNNHSWKYTIKGEWEKRENVLSRLRRIGFAACEPKIDFFSTFTCRMWEYIVANLKGGILFFPHPRICLMRTSYCVGKPFRA